MIFRFKNDDSEIKATPPKSEGIHVPNTSKTNRNYTTEIVEEEKYEDDDK